jgi:hypothetical protein
MLGLVCIVFLFFKKNMVKNLKQIIEIIKKTSMNKIKLLDVPKRPKSEISIV